MQYGVFDQELATVLPNISMDELVKIAIWLKEENVQHKHDIVEMINEVTQNEYSFTYGKSAPIIMTSMTKDDLMKLQFLDGLDRIYLNRSFKNDVFASYDERIYVPHTGVASYNEYITALWANYRGSGKKIAVVEVDKVRAMSTLSVLSYQPECSSRGFSDHATRVANIAAGDSIISGFAPDADVLAACASDEGAFEASLSWAFDQGADVATISLTVEGSNQLGLSDRIIDYMSRSRNKFITVAAGNLGGFVGSPGKAWNALTVGGFADNGHATWIDNEMWEPSAYRNPASTYGDHEKPEVVAVAGVETLSDEGISHFAYGTSRATPQVAGLATLLLNVNSNLSAWPEAIKAIIMASSVHNLVNTTFIPNPLPADLRDGAGAIVGILARDIAINIGEPGVFFPCSYSCWWGIEANNDQMPVGSTVIARIVADQGQRVRVVAAWWANATIGFHYGLETDFDLTIKDGNGVVVAFSGSDDNNYEMADFKAPNRHYHDYSVDYIELSYLEVL